ncbi:dTDP-4-dehydrorhamnose reductase [Trichococcus shcherbakoviae]|uniref:dTDP-4-dehydrorhamnose reductase n=1 Tax=Trichococcus shcherbakoviae subsp. psychrophilus TaxID=2585775 RepID=A0A5C5E759_9LACT|nr:dTDP-4-dehydrorhamnose reductase [Trichococcus shcherbakoviae]TNV68452.1 dTDP-4-dehydrorhamnose reductase [Trichococcus shcherbakoviae subsp. psychrophilus]
MILITGSNGQLGTELRNLLDEKNLAYVATDSTEMDITDKAAVEAVFKEVKPKVVYHCAAYTAVDKAEDEGKELNTLINETGTKNVAEAAEAAGATLFYVSTDYVFDGLNQEQYQVNDPANPQNEYGRAKYAGEEIVQSISSKYYIIRTSWVFGEFGNNFVYTMRRLAESYPKLTVVNDQVGRPTWTRTLAEFLLHLNDVNAEFGIYHLSNDNSCSWYEFAREILKDSDIEISPVTSEQYPQKAYRPKHSIMDLSKAKATGFKIPTWQEALKTFLVDLETVSK